jgi:DNA modification methylase
MTYEVINGDALAEMSRLTSRGVTVGMCFTDPPQEILSAAWDTMIPLEPMWDCLRNLILQERAVALMTNEPYGSLAVASNLHEYRHEWVWHKNRASNFLNAKVQPLKEHENIKVFSRRPVYYKATKEEGFAPVNFARRKANSSTAYHFHKEAINKAGDTTRYPRTVLEFDCLDNCSAERVHVNQKPVELLRYIIRLYTDEGDTVLDFAAGSFSTGVACALERRNFIGIEQSVEYCAIGEARIQRAMGIPMDIPRLNRRQIETPLLDLLSGASP